MECGLKTAYPLAAGVMDRNSPKSTKDGLHVNFKLHDKEAVKQERKKFLTAKYGQHQMNLIKKRLGVELWLLDELQKLYDCSSNSKNNHEDDVDIEELLDIDSDYLRRQWLWEKLSDCQQPREIINRFIEELLSKAKTL